MPSWRRPVRPACGSPGGCCSSPLGVIRFLFLHANPFSVWHVALDLVIVPLAAILLLRSRTGS
ncbi:hypothetical protein [Actinomadura verrucosospora]|uniref:hypothetical protein n=1 Tax=Actinomadura verrucosospora TaxID=46165 RepID=UPI0015637A00|nr:hypothetical protein [Actinomadura verrucosospora]